MKRLMGIYSAPGAHWVGDGFNVKSLFTYSNHGKHLNPFLLLDRAGPNEFSPTSHLRGVGEHPHRGFETVTIVYKGEVAHHDSTGQGGVIGAGDVQWMTAGSGILHEEYHSKEFAKSGGTFDMVQLWVNLPAKDKMTKPDYQHITSDMIPVIELADNAGSMRVIAGEYDGQKGPAKTFTPLDVWDYQLNAGSQVTIPLKENRNAGIIVLHGEVNLENGSKLQEAELAIYDKAGDSITITAEKESTILLLSGDAIDEPIFGHGPFVMNTREEIVQASLDFMQGKFGKM